MTGQSFTNSSGASQSSGRVDKICPQCGRTLPLKAIACPFCGRSLQAGPRQTLIPAKSRIAAGLLAIFLGGFGIHKFYMGQVGMGILYLLFSWTIIPSLLGIIEGIIYLCESNARFAARLNRY